MVELVRGEAMLSGLMFDTGWWMAASPDVALGDCYCLRLGRRWFGWLTHRLHDCLQW